MALVIRFFGGFKVELNGIPLPRLRSWRGERLLAYLAAKHDQNIDRVWLAEALWPPDSYDPENNMNGTLSDLKRALGMPNEEPIRIQSPGKNKLGFCPQEGDDIDVKDFDEAFRELKGHPNDKALLLKVLELYQGPFLPHWGTQDSGIWVNIRESYQKKFLVAVRRLRDLAMAEKRFDNVLMYLSRQAMAGDRNEADWVELMEAFEAQDDFTGILLTRDRFRDCMPPPSGAVTEIWDRLPPELSEVSPLLLGAGLPHTYTKMFGREALLEEIQSELIADRERLIVLTGMGGCGKSRLAAALARRVVGGFRHGLAYVNLASVTDATGINTQISLALKTTEDNIRAFLTGREILLILDNCEHILDLCVTRTRELLKDFPGIRILATSRHAFPVSAPHWEVTGLDVPPPSVPATAEAVLAYGACLLFQDRARKAAPKFRVTSENASDIAQVCRQLEGIPLALEFVAAHTDIVTHQGVSSFSSHFLSHFLDLDIQVGEYERPLTQTLGLGLNPTLRRVIDWSYDSLTEEERTLLRRLSVFAGGWTREAAGDVCLEGVTEASVLVLLKRLKAKSLVVVESQMGQLRYRLLEPIRQYGADVLSERGRDEERILTRRRHRDYFLTLAEAKPANSSFAEQAQLLDRLEADHENLRSALEWSVSQGESENSLRLTAGLALFWFKRGYFSESRKWFCRVLEMTEEPGHSLARMNVLDAAARLAVVHGELNLAQSYAGELLTLSQATGDQCCIASALKSLGIVAHSKGDPDGARDLLSQCVVIYKKLGENARWAASLSVLGEVAAALHDYPLARRLYEECRSIELTLEDQIATPSTLNNIATIASVQGDLPYAEECHLEAVRIFRSLGEQRSLAISLTNLGKVFAAQGNTNAARQHFNEGLLLCRKLGIRVNIAAALLDLGHLALSQEDFVSAKAYFDESLGISREIDDRETISIINNNLGKMRMMQNDVLRATVYYRESLIHFRDVGNPRGIAFSLEAFTDLAKHDSRMGRAAILLGAAQALRQRIGAPLLPNASLIDLLCVPRRRAHTLCAPKLDGKPITQHLC
jgi:predicted ATPase/DNA-binding SARP family transcriptional activator